MKSSSGGFRGGAKDKWGGSLLVWVLEMVDDEACCGVSALFQRGNDLLTGILHAPVLDGVPRCVGTYERIPGPHIGRQRETNTPESDDVPSLGLDLHRLMGMADAHQFRLTIQEQCVSLLWT